MTPEQRIAELGRLLDYRNGINIKSQERIAELEAENANLKSDTVTGDCCRRLEEAQAKVANWKGLAEEEIGHCKQKDEVIAKLTAERDGLQVELDATILQSVAGLRDERNDQWAEVARLTEIETAAKKIREARSYEIRERKANSASMSKAYEELCTALDADTAGGEKPPLSLADQATEILRKYRDSDAAGGDPHARCRTCHDDRDPGCPDCDTAGDDANTCDCRPAFGEECAICLAGGDR